MAAILKMETGRNFSMSGINSGHQNLPTYEISLKSNNVEFVRIVVAILKMAAGRNLSMSGINSGHHYLPTYKIFTAHFLCRILADISKILKTPLMVTYHYVKFYVSIIIH